MIEQIKQTSSINSLDRVYIALYQSALTPEEEGFVFNKAIDIDRRFYDYRTGLGSNPDINSLFIPRVIDDEHFLENGQRYLPSEEFRSRFLRNLGVLTEGQRISDLRSRPNLIQGMTVRTARLVSENPENAVRLRDRAEKLSDATLYIPTKIEGVRVNVWHQLPDISVWIERASILTSTNSLEAAAS